jgi:hypothetical protein
MRGLALAAFLTTSFACQEGDSTSPTPIRAPKSVDRLVIDGMSVERLAGGAIELRVRDRWGNAIDTTYESADFLRHALPVLRRSLTEEQVTRLEVIARETPP